MAQQQAQANRYQEHLHAQQEVTSQLRAEASVQRRPVSECIAELIKFCDEQVTSDVLVKGFVKQGDNPFKEKGGCTIV